MQKNNNRMIYIISAPVLVFAAVWVLLMILFNRTEIFAFIKQPAVASMITSTFLTTIGFGAFSYYIFTRELSLSMQDIRDILMGKYQNERKRRTWFPMLNRINQAIQEIAEGQKQQLLDLSQRTKELDEKNAELNDAYLQMESSYGQLQAALEQLNESEQRYHSLVRNIPDVVLTLDDSGNITYASRACHDILKFRRHDIVGKPFESIINPQSSSSFDFKQLKENIKIKGELAWISLCKERIGPGSKLKLSLPPLWNPIWITAFRQSFVMLPNKRGWKRFWSRPTAGLKY